MSPLRKKTLRKMPPKTRELARIIQEAESAITRLKNRIPVLIEMEMAERALEKAGQAREKESNSQNLEVFQELRRLEGGLTMAYCPEHGIEMRCTGDSISFADYECPECENPWRYDAEEGSYRVKVEGTG